MSLPSGKIDPAEDLKTISMHDAIETERSTVPKAISYYDDLINKHLSQQASANEISSSRQKASAKIKPAEPDDDDPFDEAKNKDEFFDEIFMTCNNKQHLRTCLLCRRCAVQNAVRWTAAGRAEASSLRSYLRPILCFLLLLQCLEQALSGICEISVQMQKSGSCRSSLAFYATGLKIFTEATLSWLHAKEIDDSCQERALHLHPPCSSAAEECMRVHLVTCSMDEALRQRHRMACLGTLERQCTAFKDSLQPPLECRSAH